MIATKNFMKGNFTREERLKFLDYLTTSLQNGFSLSASIELMPVLWPEKGDVIKQMAFSMKNGGDFGVELLKISFSKTTVTQIRMALQQGNLVECLKQLTILERVKNEQIKKLKVELSYPFVLATMMVCLLLFMQTFVSTQFTEQNEYTGDILIATLVILVISTGAFFVKVLQLLAKEDYLSLKKLSKYPFIGSAIKIYVSYLLVYDIGILLASGFSLQKICEYAANQDEGSLQQYLGVSIGRKLDQGQSLNEIIKNEQFLPDELIMLIQIGSKRSNLSTRFLILGRSFFNELTRKIEKMVVSVQPICFVLLGICIIGMYLKLLLPMYAMMQGI